MVVRINGLTHVDGARLARGCKYLQPRLWIAGVMALGLFLGTDAVAQVPTRTPSPKVTGSPRATPAANATAKPQRTPTTVPSPAKTASPKVTPTPAVPTAKLTTVYGPGGVIGVVVSCGTGRKGWTSATIVGYGEISGMLTTGERATLYAELTLVGDRDLRTPSVCSVQSQTLEGSLTLSTVAKKELRNTENTVVDRTLQCNRQRVCSGTLSQVVISIPK